MNNKSISYIWFLILALVLTACSTNAAAQTSETTQRTLAVTATGRSYLTPDIAYINIGVRTEASDAAEAVDTNNTLSQQVKESLDAYDINPSDIQTTYYSIWPNQQYDSEGKITGISYMVDNTVRVVLRDATQVGEVLDTVIDAGANRIDSIQFDVEDRSEALTEARQAALANAEIQAQELADAAGLEVGEIISISSFGGGTPSPMFEGMGGGGMGAAAEANVPVSPGQLVVSVDVSMVYELVP